MAIFPCSDYQPDGAVKDASLVAPEALLLTAPTTIGYLNAVFSSVEWGLTACNGGLVYSYSRDLEELSSCHYSRNPVHSELFVGSFTYTPGGAGSNLINPAEQSRRYSSVYNDDPVGTGLAMSMLGSMAAWVPQTSTGAAGEWLDIDLGTVHQVTGVVTQHRARSRTGIARFTVQHSTDGSDYETLPQTFFRGDNGIVTGTGQSMFAEAVGARYVRIVLAEAYARGGGVRAGVLVAASTVPPLANFTHFNANGSSASEVVAELDVVLTGGRLGHHSRDVIEHAFDASLSTVGHEPGALKIAEQLILAAPEFQLTGGNPAPIDPAPLPFRARPQAGSGTPEPYKAIVYLFLAGGADSYNMLIPYDGCGASDKFAEYHTARGEIALEKDTLLPITAHVRSRNSTQACSRFGLHPGMATVQRMYNDGDALWIANVGALDEPITKAEYDAKSKRTPAQLFAHNTQTRFTQNLDARTSARGDGVLGRALDALGHAGMLTGSYSIAGAGATALEPVDSIPFDVFNAAGITTISEFHADLIPAVKNLTSRASSSPFANAWSSLVGTTLNRTGELSEALASVSLEQPFTASGTGLGLQLKQVATLMKANQQTFHNEREAYYVSLGGFDVHADAIERMELLMATVDDALASFEAEMKLQGLWSNITIVQASEFGRTLTSNGDGSDHAWGGNYWVAGGGVRGGQILGKFPADLSEGSELNLGRGRLIPTTSWEHIWSAVGEWLGVSTEAMGSVLPRRANFPDLFAADSIFQV